MDEIGLRRIDTLIVSFPDKVFVHEDLPSQLVMPVWSIIQELIDSQIVNTAGLSDFNAAYLEQFCNFLQDKNVGYKIFFSNFLIFVFRESHQ